MEAKDKAKELFNKMYEVEDFMGNYPMCFDTAKKCALICVDEIIASIPTQPSKSETERIEAISYWIEVKSEIENYKNQ